MELLSRLPKKTSNTSAECKVKNCGKIFKTLALLNIHLKQVHAERIMCPVSDCGRYYKPFQRTEHRKFCHGASKGICDHCKTNMEKSKLPKHIEKCILQDKIKCRAENCIRMFITHRLEKHHYEKAHAELMSCPEKNCKSVIKPAYLNSHWRIIHNKDNTRDCEICGKAVHVNLMASHITREHSSNKKKTRAISCTAKLCDREFNTKEEMIAHREKEHREKICCPHTSCGILIGRVSLVKHLKNVHEKIRNPCQNCGKQFIRSSLWKHERKCNKNIEFKFRCSIDGCAGKFFSKKGLLVHLKLADHSKMNNYNSNEI